MTKPGRTGEPGSGTVRARQQAPYITRRMCRGRVHDDETQERLEGGPIALDARALGGILKGVRGVQEGWRDEHDVSFDVHGRGRGDTRLRVLPRLRGAASIS